MMTDAERDAKRIQRIEAGIQEAKKHGHPGWSHLFAHGPCTKRSVVK